MRTSQERASSNPPLKALPWMAAMTGWGSAAIDANAPVSPPRACSMASAVHPGAEIGALRLEDDDPDRVVIGDVRGGVRQLSQHVRAEPVSLVRAGEREPCHGAAFAENNAAFAHAGPFVTSPGPRIAPRSRRAQEDRERGDRINGLGWCQGICPAYTAFAARNGTSVPAGEGFVRIRRNVVQQGDSPAGA